MTGFNYDKYTWTNHAIKNLRKRIGPMTTAEADRMLEGGVRLTKSRRKMARKQSPCNSSIYMGKMFKGRYWLLVADRYIIVICQPMTIITCWDMLADKEE